MAFGSTIPKFPCSCHNHVLHPNPPLGLGLVARCLPVVKFCLLVSNHCCMSSRKLVWLLLGRLQCFLYSTLLMQPSIHCLVS